jgi:hypothetical protein
MGQAGTSRIPFWYNKYVKILRRGRRGSTVQDAILEGPEWKDSVRSPAKSRRPAKLSTGSTGNLGYGTWMEGRNANPGRLRTLYCRASTAAKGPMPRENTTVQ